MIMETLNLTSPAQIKNILREKRISLRKKWGQNFLVDQNTVNKILHLVKANPEDYILEIGSGVGVLTLPLAQTGARLLAIEIDHGLTTILKGWLHKCPRVKIKETDIRKENLADLSFEAWGKIAGVKIVANLPYYITSSFIYRLLIGEMDWNQSVLMVQKEVARRMVARPGSSDYGALSVLVDCFTQAEYKFSVSRNVFYPAPKVDSAVITMHPNETKYLVFDKVFFKKIVFAAFGQRRKTILNALHGSLKLEKKQIEQWLEKAQIDRSMRAEELSTGEFAMLSRLIYNNLR